MIKYVLLSPKSYDLLRDLLRFRERGDVNDRLRWSTRRFKDICLLNITKEDWNICLGIANDDFSDSEFYSLYHESIQHLGCQLINCECDSDFFEEEEGSTYGK